VAFGLLQMGLQRILQLRLGRGLDHFGQRFGDLGFSGMEMLKLVNVEFSKTIKICRKEFHDLTSQGWLDLSVEK
jgi:hypothetical protein